MSNHDYDGCHDQACDLCAAYAAGKDKARGELGQPDAALIFSEIQTRRNGKRWHNDHGYDFHKQAQNVHELKAWGLKQITIAAVVRLSPGRVSQILSQGL